MENNTEPCVKILTGYLADMFILYFKTHSFHWNVTGLHFYSLHEMFGKQYEELFESLDEIAERIRGIGGSAPISFAQLLPLASLNEEKNKLGANDMIKSLLVDHETLASKIGEWIDEIARIGDSATEDFLTGRLAEHQKMAWILGAHLA